jgi:hypothetical protein
MKQESNNTNFRRIVTQTVNGKAVIESDGQIENYAFTNVPGYFHSLVWINPAIPDLKKKQTFDRYPDSVVPGPGGSSFHVVTYPVPLKVKIFELIDQPRISASLEPRRSKGLHQDITPHEC